MGVKATGIDLKIASLAEEINKAQSHIKTLTYSGVYRPHVYALAYSCACLGHCKAFLLLVREGHWPSTYPIVRAAVEAMIRVDELSADPIQAIKDIEYSSVDERLSWRHADHRAALGLPDVDNGGVDLKGQRDAWTALGAKHPKITDRIKLVDAGVSAEVITETGDDPDKFFALWKRCSQSAHMGGNQIAHLMCSVSDQGSISVTPELPPPDEIVNELASGCHKSLCLTMHRLDNLMFNTRQQSDNGEMILRHTSANDYNALLAQAKAYPALAST